MNYIGKVKARQIMRDVYRIRAKKNKLHSQWLRLDVKESVIMNKVRRLRSFRRVKV